MAKKSNKKSTAEVKGKFKKPNTRTKNIVRSMKNIGISTIKDLMPNATDTIRDNKEFIAEKYSSLTKTAEGTKRVDELKKFFNETKQNFMDDLKSGNWNNEERSDNEMFKAMGVDLGDFDFDDEDDDFFSSSESDESSDNFVMNEVDDDDIFNDDNGSSNFTSSTNIKNTKNIKNTFIKTSSGDAKRTISALSSIGNSIISINGAGFSSINETLNDILSFHNDNTTQFYNEMSEKMSSLAESIANLEKISAQSVLQESLLLKDVEDNFDLLLESNFNLGNLFKGSSGGTIEMYKSMAQMMLPMFSGMIKGNPLGELLKLGTKALIPSSVKKSLGNLDKQLTNLPMLLNDMAYNQAGKDNWLGKISGKLVDWDIVKKLNRSANSKDKSEFFRSENRQVPFDSDTKKAITDVIPDYLGKIYQALAGGEERFYDYRSGSWTTKEQVDRDYQKAYERQISGRDSYEFRDLVKAIQMGKYDGKNINTSKINEDDLFKIIKLVQDTDDGNIVSLLSNSNIDEIMKRSGASSDSVKAMMETINRMGEDQKINLSTASRRLTQDSTKMRESYYRGNGSRIRNENIGSLYKSFEDNERKYQEVYENLSDRELIAVSTSRKSRIDGKPLQGNELAFVRKLIKEREDDKNNGYGSAEERSSKMLEDYYKTGNFYGDDDTSMFESFFGSFISGTKLGNKLDERKKRLAGKGPNALDKATNTALGKMNELAGYNGRQVSFIDSEDKEALDSDQYKSSGQKVSIGGSSVNLPDVIKISFSRDSELGTSEETPIYTRLVGFGDSSIDEHLNTVNDLLGQILQGVLNIRVDNAEIAAGGVPDGEDSVEVNVSANSELGKKYADAAKTVEREISKATSEAEKNAANEKMEELKEKNDEEFQEYSDTFKENLDKMGEMATGKLTSKLNNTKLFQMFPFLGSLVGDKIGKGINSIGTIAKNIGGSALNKLSPITSAFSDAKNSVMGKLEKKFPGVSKVKSALGKAGGGVDLSMVPPGVTPVWIVGSGRNGGKYNKEEDKLSEEELKIKKDELKIKLKRNIDFIKDNKEEIKERIKERAKNKAHNAKERLLKSAHNAKERVKDLMHNAKERVKDSLGNLKDRAVKTAGTVAGTVASLVGRGVEALGHALSAIPGGKLAAAGIAAAGIAAIVAFIKKKMKTVRTGKDSGGGLNFGKFSKASKTKKSKEAKDKEKKSSLNFDDFSLTKKKSIYNVPTGDASKMDLSKVPENVVPVYVMGMGQDSKTMEKITDLIDYFAKKYVKKWKHEDTGGEESGGSGGSELSNISNNLSALTASALTPGGLDPSSVNSVLTNMSTTAGGNSWVKRVAKKSLGIASHSKNKTIAGLSSRAYNSKYMSGVDGSQSWKSLNNEAINTITKKGAINGIGTLLTGGSITGTTGGTTNYNSSTGGSITGTTGGTTNYNASNSSNIPSNSYPVSSSSSINDDELLNVALNMTKSLESGGDYGMAHWDVDGPSGGIIQWHDGPNANNLTNLLVKIRNEDPNTFDRINNGVLNIGQNLTSQLPKGSSNYKVLNALLSSNAGKKIQDEEAKKYISTYFEAARKKGIKNPGNLLFYSDVANRGMYSKSLATATQGALQNGDTVDAFYNTLKTTKYYDDNWERTRYEKVYSIAKQYDNPNGITSSGSATSTATPKTQIDSHQKNWDKRKVVNTTNQAQYKNDKEVYNKQMNNRDSGRRINNNTNKKHRGGGGDSKSTATANSYADESDPTNVPVLGGKSAHVIADFPHYSDGSNHSGIDLVTPVGTPVTALRDGTVEDASPYGKQDHSLSAESNYGFGGTVKINHNGFWSRYAHMSKLAVNKGDTVKKGQVIGYSGNTGHSYGAHLHFQIDKAAGFIGNTKGVTEGLAANPAPYLQNENYTGDKDLPADTSGSVQESSGSSSANSSSGSAGSSNAISNSTASPSSDISSLMSGDTSSIMSGNTSGLMNSVSSMVPSSMSSLFSGGSGNSLNSLAGMGVSLLSGNPLMMFSSIASLGSGTGLSSILSKFGLGNSNQNNSDNKNSMVEMFGTVGSTLMGFGSGAMSGAGNAMSGMLTSLTTALSGLGKLLNSDKASSIINSLGEMFGKKSSAIGKTEDTENLYDKFDNIIEQFNTLNETESQSLDVLNKLLDAFTDYKEVNQNKKSREFNLNHAGVNHVLQGY